MYGALAIGSKSIRRGKTIAAEPLHQPVIETPGRCQIRDADAQVVNNVHGSVPYLVLTGTGSTPVPTFADWFKGVGALQVGRLGVPDLGPVGLGFCNCACLVFVEGPHDLFAQKDIELAVNHSREARDCRRTSYRLRRRKCRTRHFAGRSGLDSY